MNAHDPGDIRLIVTIDGPAGSGKSTIAKMLARYLHFHYLDTGAMYRALTWKAIQEKVNLEDEDALCRLMDETLITFKQKDPDNLEIFVDGINVTNEIRLPLITNNTHHISDKPGVRKKMVKLQQEIAAKGNTIAEGRDMGTVVFPDAEIKFFLDAKVEERAKRRYEELKTQDSNSTIEDVAKDIALRDQRDTTRKASPLKKGSGAIYIDTTNLGMEEVFHLLRKEIESFTRK